MRFDDLTQAAQGIAARLISRRETVAVAESSTGGLVSAALLSVPGASAYFLGGGVIYTARARSRLLDLHRDDVEGMRSASEPYALLLGRAARDRLGAAWGVSETGAAGPTRNSYGDAAGHSCVAISGPVERVMTLETGGGDRVGNMHDSALALLTLFEQALDEAGEPPQPA